MKPSFLFLAAGLWASLSVIGAPAGVDPSAWTVYIANDTCPDYTWGHDEALTRKNFAELIRSHLDEMTRTDPEREENRDHYNTATTEEVLCFLERYPEREDELVRRLREGRLLLSPFLCNSLWGFQSAESALRTLYPARRLERRWGIPLEVAHHIECPSLPWGVPTLLAGCGIRWLNLPFLEYDCTFAGLRNPPAFIHEGPDGSQVRVLLDRFASCKANYTQGASLLEKPATLTGEWIPHYEQLGAAWPVKLILASGTHGDTHPHSAGQTAQFSDTLRRLNTSASPRPTLVNATFAQFFARIDQAHDQAPFLSVWRGSFGHSWELWPVSLAKSVADLRENDRRFLAAETLVAWATLIDPGIRAATRAERERAEWCWAMLSDHAWNGSDDANRRENARLRRDWNRELRTLTTNLVVRGWAGLGLEPAAGWITVFNSLSVPRSALVQVPTPEPVGAVLHGERRLEFQIVPEDGRESVVFVSPEIEGFGRAEFRLEPGRAGAGRVPDLEATPTRLESRYYRLVLDPATGGFRSLVHKPTETELLAGDRGRTIAQTVFFDGSEHRLESVTSDVLTTGPVLARLRVTGAGSGIRVTNLVTVYDRLDQVDFDLRLDKAPTIAEQRLGHLFPLLRPGAQLRIECPGAVIRPRPAPAGDLLEGADPRRFAVQGFVDVSHPTVAGVTVAPLDAFVLRVDLDPIYFEALGNDQNYREVTKDQDGVRQFRFRYVLRAHSPGFPAAQVFAWSRIAATPLLWTWGRVATPAPPPRLHVDPSRALAMCLKPVDDPDSSGLILRLWETRGDPAPISLQVQGFREFLRTDLLERDLERLSSAQDVLEVPCRPCGFTSLRLVP